MDYSRWIGIGHKAAWRALSGELGWWNLLWRPAVLGAALMLAIGLGWGPPRAWAHTPEEKAFYLQSRIVLRLNPADLRAGDAVGVWHLEYSQLDEARAAFHRVLERHPGHFLAAAGLALSEEADGHLERALALLPEATVAPGEFAGFLALVRGRLLVRLGRRGEASRVLDWSLEHGGYPHDVRFWQGRVLELDGETGPAIARYREAIEADPFWTEAYARLSALLQRQGDTAGARKVLEQVLELHNPSPYPNNDIRVLWAWVMGGVLENTPEGGQG